jgi:hypothetical protein
MLFLPHIAQYLIDFRLVQEPMSISESFRPPERRPFATGSLIGHVRVGQSPSSAFALRLRGSRASGHLGNGSRISR